MNQVVIRPDELIEFMGKENYCKFMEKMRVKKNIKNVDGGIWIIAEWSEK